MGPGEAAAQNERHAVPDSQIVKARADFAAAVRGVRRGISQAEAAAGEIGLAVARRMEVLHLQGRIGRDADDVPGDRQSEAVTGFAARRIALALEFRRETVAERDAVRREPMIGEGERAGEVCRPEMRRAVT